MDDIEIEVFRADTAASRGITATDLADLASAYNADANPAAICIGHPKNDSPAKGTIKAFRAAGSNLFATLTGIADDLVESVKKGELINRSMAFFSPDHEANPTPGKLAPRHLGFLGAAAPGIPGMAPLKAAFEFSADEDAFTVVGAPAEAIVFEAPATPVLKVKDDPKMPTEEEMKAREDAVAKREADAQERDRQFAADRQTAREGANKARVATLVTAGKILPAKAGELEMVFNALSDGVLEFAADDKADPADKLAGILAGLPKVVDTSGKPITLNKAPEFAAVDKTDHKALTAAARGLMAKDTTLTFEAALEQVSQEN